MGLVEAPGSRQSFYRLWQQGVAKYRPFLLKTLSLASKSPLLTYSEKQLLKTPKVFVLW